MKILIKNKKWNISFGETVLVCDVFEREGIFYINFSMNNKIIKIKSRNIDKTLRALEEAFTEEKQERVA